MRFSIRDLFLVTMIVALAVGWWVDRAKLTSEQEALILESIYSRAEVWRRPWNEVVGGGSRGRIDGRGSPP